MHEEHGTAEEPRDDLETRLLRVEELLSTVVINNGLGDAVTETWARDMDKAVCERLGLAVD